jgi:hypothetical protein
VSSIHCPEDLSDYILRFAEIVWFWEQSDACVGDGSSGAFSAAINQP